ncbi:hypothetical protein U472_03285 [Orenia metallireducens]|jgi:very-short-patch-repair endonuclease|uniref:DUF559 domain-containing protein n=1 Tax=Orenia metallireducens TaxID=1413210 RepID=A0A1C0AB49_9FIRM|nr:endonuclease domain-containing protein [Orenia metallireducens]OCL27590.1 hypothetical protein U472_03285 [Orenia metallireducens]
MTDRIFNKNKTKEKRRSLRQKETEAEKITWNRLRGRKFMELKFRRQYSIGEYIVDFYCPELNLVVEIDGLIHFRKENREYDKVRTEFINSLGIKVVRFRNKEVLEDIDTVLAKLKDYISDKR